MNKRFRLSSLIALILAINFILMVGYTPAKPATTKKPTTSVKKKAVVKKPTKLKTVTKQVKPVVPAKKAAPVKPVSTPKPTPKATPKPTPKATSTVKVEERPMGLFYKVKAGDATVYILGSMHVTKPDMFPFNKKVEDAFASSKYLVVEADITDATAAAKLQSKLYYDTNDDIYNHLTAAGKERYDAIIKLGSMDVNAVKNLKPWAFGSSLMTGIAIGSGFGNGVDSYFLEKAKEKKTILELEGIEFQFNMMNSLSDIDQENSFIIDVKDVQSIVSELNSMYVSYKAGDDKKLSELLLKSDVNLSPDYTKKFYTDRNIGMADKIDGYLKTKDTYFVIAGAAHFLGESSVLELLSKKGYVIERIK